MTLVDEGRRQLDICNACRYCEGYCAVYPALERRIDLTDGDLLQLANLCHDCRACYYACMYAPPHDFALNPPQLLAEIRRGSFVDLVPFAGSAPRLRNGIVVVAMTALLLGVIGATRGLHSLVAVHHHAASPYSVLPYAATLAVGLGAAAPGVVFFIAGGVAYWRRIGASPAASSGAAPWLRAGHDAATLKYLRSAGVECTYPDEAASPLRRRLHSALAGGFLLALAATVSAGILQDFLSHPPPYSLASAPVILGLLGGVGMLIGGAGLLGLKGAADPEPGDPATTASDKALLADLLVLATTGLLTLIVRESSAYGIVFALHLDAVFTAFVLAPFTKFAHVVFRFLALVRDEQEQAAERA